jgi:hypothetical protein
MSIVDIFSGIMIGGGAIAMAAATLGPFYLFFHVFPKMAEDARREHFFKLRRTKRKERSKARAAVMAVHAEVPSI